jgi:hypothetical protein
MGVVYRALHTRLRRVVALKVLPAERTRDAGAVARFEREMEAVGRLEHPHIVRATDAGEADGCHFLVMEYVPGIDLARLVRLCGALEVADACALVRQAALGLQHAHEAGLVHRDIKPSNLMVTPEGVVKLLDLGLALLHGQLPAAEDLTPSGQAMGTADYMAPEQALDSHVVDIRADIYSLGCTLYKLLTGQAPFGGGRYSSTFKKMTAHAHEPVPPVRDLRPEVPEGLAAVLDRLLAKEPAGRFATPQEVADALAPFAAADCPGLVARALALAPPEHQAGGAEAGAGLRDHERPTPRLRRATPAPAGAPARPRRRRWLVLEGVLAAVLAVAVGIALWPRPEPPGPPRPPEPPGPQPQRPAPQPGAWRDLLHEEPAKLYWQDPKLASFLRHEPERGEVRVDSGYVSLLGLAQVSQTAYRFQVGIRQTTWVGGVGVFFGYQEGTYNAKPCVKYQTLEFRPYKKNSDEEAFRLYHSRAVIPRTADGFGMPSPFGVASVPLRRPRNREEHILDVEVRPTGLARVAWDGQVLAQLVKPRGNRKPAPADHAGQLGLFAHCSSSVFGNCRLMVFDQGGP